MQQLIEQLAKDTGITHDEINYILIAVSGQIINKIPAMQQVIEDVLENVGTEILKDHINKMTILLQQQQWAEQFGSWTLPSGRNSP